MYIYIYICIYIYIYIHIYIYIVQFVPRRGTGKLCNHSQKSTIAMKMHAHAAKTNIITTQVNAAL